MKSNDIREYAEIMQDWGLQRLTVTENGATVCLEKDAAAAPAPVSAVPVFRDPADEPEITDHHDTISIKSPMVGVFYAAPAENADPFVTAGTEVSEGDTVCIIEAMKLMNEVRSECSGTVEEICVANGQVVEYGTELFRIRR